MSNIVKGLAWATAILLTAIFKNYGVIAEDVGKVMLVILPIIAVMSLRDQADCRKGCAS